MWSVSAAEERLMERRVVWWFPTRADVGVIGVWRRTRKTMRGGDLFCFITLTKKSGRILIQHGHYDFTEINVYFRFLFCLCSLVKSILLELNWIAFCTKITENSSQEAHKQSQTFSCWESFIQYKHYPLASCFKGWTLSIKFIRIFFFNIKFAGFVV